MTETTTYTVFNPNSGTVEERGVSAAWAAQIILNDQGFTYELRFDPKHDVAGEHLYELFGATRFSREPLKCWSGQNGVMTYAASEEAAWPKIAKMVIHARWPGHLEAMADADYDTMMAEAEG